MFERGKTNMNRRYRKTIIAGNWKMNKTPAEAKALIEEMKPLLSKTTWCEMVLCVPFTDIQAAVKAAKGSKIAIGAENMHFEKSGAFTGEISADMLKELGVKYVIIAPPERRQCANETRREARQEGSGRSRERSAPDPVRRRVSDRARAGRYHGSYPQADQDRSAERSC